MPPYPLLSKLLAPPLSYDAATLHERVKDITILVTGASFGIGEALARRLGLAGARVLVAARTAEPLEKLVSDIEAAGGQAQAYILDLTNSEHIEQVSQRILADHGSVDVLVHNAGKSIRRSLHKSLDRAHDFERTMAVNYQGPVRLQLALLPSMIAKKSGHIINVSSVGVRIPPAAHWAAYTASKSAFDIWLRCGAPELRNDGIDCTTVYFGLVHTRMSAPTEAYASMPGLTAHQAASVLCRAILKSPRSLQPWWLGPVYCLSAPLGPVAEWLQSQVLKRAKT